MNCLYEKASKMLRSECQRLMLVGFVVSGLDSGFLSAQQTKVQYETGMSSMTPSKGVSGGCAKAEKLNNLCVDIAERVEEPIESPFAYRYERLVHEAACADPEKDSEDLINRKIQSMWVKLDPKCNNANFDVPRGSVLKYSILTRNYDFISLAAEIWKVNLNAIDPSDNRTLLDYIQKEAERNKGTKAETILKGYYKTLRELGAKHRSEL